MMERFSTSVHMLDGRVRVQVHEAKRNPAKVREIEHSLAGQDGITKVSGNPVTGSVLIHYDVRRLRQADLLACLKVLGYLKDAPGSVSFAPGTSFQRFHDHLTDTLVRSTMEVALQSVIRALI